MLQKFRRAHNCAISLPHCSSFVHLLNQRSFGCSSKGKSVMIFPTNFMNLTEHRSQRMRFMTLGCILSTTSFEILVTHFLTSQTCHILLTIGPIQSTTV